MCLLILCLDRLGCMLSFISLANLIQHWEEILHFIIEVWCFLAYRGLNQIHSLGNTLVNLDIVT